MQPKSISAPAKGLIIALIMIVYSLIIYFAGLYSNKTLTLIQYIIFGGGIIWSCIDYAKNNVDGTTTFGNTFAHGFKVTAAITAIVAVYTYFSLKFLMPEMMDYSIEEARKGMIANNQMTTEQIDQALAMTKKFFIPFTIGGLLVAFLIFGVIFSLIGAAVSKKYRNNNPFKEL
jgi:hypothetical protein